MHVAIGLDEKVACVIVRACFHQLDLGYMESKGFNECVTSSYDLVNASLNACCEDSECDIPTSIFYNVHQCLMFQLLFLGCSVGVSILA